MANISSKISQVSLSLQGKYRYFLVPMIKFKLSSENSNFQKFLLLLTYLPILKIKNCSNKTSSDTDKRHFFVKALPLLSELRC